MVVFPKIFEQAYRITKQYRFLWIFGLFLFAGNLLFAWFIQTDQLINISDFQLVLFFSGFILFFVLYFRCKAGLIISIKAILDKQETSVDKAFKVSRLFYSRILGIYFMLELGLFILGFLIASPIEYMFSHHYLYRGILLLILGLLFFIPVAVLVLLINVLAPLFVVIFDLQIREAVSHAFELVSKYWVKLTLLALLLFIIEIPALFLGAIVVGLRGGLGFTIAGAIVFLTVGSGIAVFAQTVWVLEFLDLIKPQRIEEKEPVVMPEVPN